MDIKLLLLMNCVIVANCQSTITKRNDAAYECEAPIDTKSEMESIRQLLMNLQQAAVRNERDIGEIRQILIQQLNGNETQAMQETQRIAEEICQTMHNQQVSETQTVKEIKSRTDEIREIVLKQHHNESQAMQEIKLITGETRRILFKQHGNETQTMQDMKSKADELREIVLRQHRNGTEAMQEMRSTTDEIRQLLFKQHVNETRAMHEMKSTTDEIRQLLYKQHVNETRAMHEMKSTTDEIRQLLFKQHVNETRAMHEMKSTTDEIRLSLFKQHVNETKVMRDMKSKTDEIRQLMFKQHGNETKAMHDMKSKTDEIRQIMLSQHAMETQTMNDMKSKLEEIQRAVQQQNRPRKGCPPGFDYLPEVGSCYRVIYDGMTWNDATKRCRQVMPGVHLAAITSKDENDAIARYLRLNPSSNGSSACVHPRFPDNGNLIWIGGQTRNSSQCGDPYVWKPLKGIEIPFTYTNWRGQNPDCHESAEHCAEIETGINYKWNDYNCDLLCCAICELHV